MIKYGVLVISHGSRKAEWVDLVDQAVAAVEVDSDIPIYSSFLELIGGRLIQDGIYSLEQQGVTDILVVPLFVSSGSTHIDEISYALGLISEPTLKTDLIPLKLQARVHFGRPMDDDEEIVQILYSKIQPLSQRPSHEIVLLVGHGSVEKHFHLRWRKGLELLAARLKIWGGFDEVDIAMLLPDQVKRKMELWTKRKPEHTVIVAPLFLSEGYFTNQVIPLRMREFSYKYNGKAMLPHPLISRWMERQIRQMIGKTGDK
jgi:sirohydrochlorin ferrochelatase